MSPNSPIWTKLRKIYSLRRINDQFIIYGVTEETWDIPEASGRTLLLWVTGERSMVQQEAELTHRCSGNCLTARTAQTDLPGWADLHYRGKTSCGPFPDSEGELYNALDCTALVPQFKSSSGPFVWQLKIIYIHKQWYRTSVKIIPNIQELAAS